MITRWRRRDFIRLSAQAGGILNFGPAAEVLGARENELEATPTSGSRCESPRSFNGAYDGTRLSQIAFPMGGMGAGMVCLEGTGALSKFSLHNRPDLHEPKVFAAISIRAPQMIARVLEGPVPGWKLRPQFPGEYGGMPPAACWGLPRFREAVFAARFPFATVHLKDDEMPVEVKLTGWSPFAPGDADNASLPVAGLEYTFINRSHTNVDAVFSFNAENFMATPSDPIGRSSNSTDRIGSTAGGFVLYGAGAAGRPWDEGYCAAWVDDSNAKVNHAWFRGGWPDSVQMIWNDIVAGKCYARDPLPNASSPGASIFVPFSIPTRQTNTIKVLLAWYVPKSNLFEPNFLIKNAKLARITHGTETYRPWYAARFAGIDEVKSYWHRRYQSLRQAAEKFTRAFYDSTLPPEVIEAVAANLAILKSPTVLRQADGRLWGWEGSYDSIGGGGYGSSNHVWNYAQSIAHLFPDLERSLRETEFVANQGKDGFQAMRAALPIRPIGDTEEGRYVPAAADGQLGGIIKVYREWKISGDTAWLRGLWPRIRASLDYCIRTWDPQHRGWLEEAHLNTYDVEFWGADSLCTSIYLGALKAATLMGEALGEDTHQYAKLLSGGIPRMETELYNGVYFFQKIETENLRTPFPPKERDALAQLYSSDSVEELELTREEGPKYQYGQGCLSDGVLGAWLCFACGVGDLLDRRKVQSHLIAVHRYNLKKTLADHANVIRAALACGDDSGLLLCTWPRGGRPLLPVLYADEVWTGIEYQVASHLIALGNIDEGLDIVRACRRRYDGRIRNPFAEVEAGHWYARAMSSYALLQAFSGARFDAVDKTLYLKPAIKGDFRCFLSTATGFGTVGLKNGEPIVEVVFGTIPYAKINYSPPDSRA